MKYPKPEPAPVVHFEEQIADVEKGTRGMSGMVSLHVSFVRHLIEYVRALEAEINREPTVEEAANAVRQRLLDVPAMLEPIFDVSQPIRANAIKAGFSEGAAEQIALSWTLNAMAGLFNSPAVPE